MCYVNQTLEESEFDVAIIHVGVNNLLNCQGDIEQINSILRIIEHIAHKCRQYGVKNIFLSALTITNELPEQLIKYFNISICNICNQAPNCDYIDNTNIKLNEVCRDGFTFQVREICFDNYLDKICKIFLEVVQHPRMDIHCGTLV